jgi:hypothetical protein
MKMNYECIVGVALKGTAEFAAFLKVSEQVLENVRRKMHNTVVFGFFGFLGKSSQMFFDFVLLKQKVYSKRNSVYSV